MTDYERIERVIKYLENHHREQPQLPTLAKFAGLSESHLHRLFSRWAGTTPKSFLKSLTAEHAKELLRESRDLLSVSLQTGLSGPGRLHDLIVSVEGLSPGEFKAQGLGLEIRYGLHKSPFGICLIGVTHRGLCHLAFVDPQHPKAALEELRTKWPHAKLRSDRIATTNIAKNLFSRDEAKPSLLLAGTPFQLKVWQALLKIPQGHVLSYSDIATNIDCPGASRAVGTAVGKNSIAYLIPCHRVIRETGVIGGYRWGHSRKQAMLAWENAR